MGRIEGTRASGSNEGEGLLNETGRHRQTSSGDYRDHLNPDVVLKRQGGVLPKLYNCGSFVNCICHMRFHLR